MAGNTIIVRSGDVFILVGGVRITDMPAVGTYASIEKMTARSAATEGQHNTVTYARQSSSMYRLTLTVIQGSDSDVWLAGTIKALDATNSVVPVSITHKGMKYVSGNCDIETEPTRALAGDSNPDVVYTLVGIFPIAKVVAFGEPVQLDETQISAYL